MVKCKECGKDIGATGWVQTIKPKHAKYKEQLPSSDNILSINRQTREERTPNVIKSTYCIDCYQNREDLRTVKYPWQRILHNTEKADRAKKRVMRF